MRPFRMRLLGTGTSARGGRSRDDDHVADPPGQPAPRDPDPADRLGPRSVGLELLGISKLYGDVRAVDGVDLSVQNGEFLTLLGPSGSGKTTTLRLVAGFARPTAGVVKIAGEDMTSTPPHRRDVGMVFQNYALFPHMTVRDNLAFPLQMRKIPRKEQLRLVDEVLALVRLEGFGARYPRQLSGGQQQRVALARAIVYKPRVLLMDEPLGALDKKLREALQLEIRHLHELLGITVLYVTHDQEEALVLSDRIALFNNGRIVQLGGPTDLYQRPKSVFVADFIGDSNVFHGRLERVGDGWELVSGEWRFPCEPRDGATVDAGAPSAIVVRLEHVMLRDVDAPVDYEGPRIVGQIREAIYLGPFVKYEIDVNGKVLFARREVTREARLREAGEAVAVGWRREDGLLVQE